MIEIKKKLNYVFDIVLILVIGVLTFRLLFRTEELPDIIKLVGRADKRWLLLGLLFVFCFVAGESAIIRYMLRLFRVRLPFVRCLKYSFIGFFFSCITPSASGGQPAQMYYMKKDGIKLGHSTLIMMVITAAYKAVLVFLGLFFIVFRYSYIMKHVGDLWWLMLVGFVLNVAFIIGLIFLFLRPLWAKSLAKKLVRLLIIIKILKKKNYERYAKRISRVCDTYMVGAEYIKHNVKAVAKVFLITLVQRCFLLSVTWIVYKSYGLYGARFIDIIAIQAIIAITVEMLPLPGAAGITEGCFSLMFIGVFPEMYLKPALLLSRGLSFYALLLISAAVTLAAHVIMIRKEKRYHKT